MQKFSFFLAFLFLGCTAMAQTVSGTITDSNTAAPIANASIYVKEAKLFGISDALGNFIINLPQAGNYTLEISHLSYEKKSQKIEVGNSELQLETISLEPALFTVEEDIVVTAQRSPRSRFEVPEAVTRVSQQDIQESGFRTAPEALIGATGVWVQKTNHGSGSPFLRGLTGNQTLLMLDGVRLNNSTYRYGPNQYFVLVNPLNIRQIEVVRGAGSVLYGSDAMGGTIQVLTRAPKFSADKWTFGGSAFAKYWSDDMEKTGRAELELSGKNAAFLAGFDYKDFGDLVAGGNLGTLAPSAYTEQAADFKSLFKLGSKGLLTLAYNGVFQQDVGRYDQVAQRGFAFWQFNPQTRQLGYARYQLQGNDTFKEWNVTASWQNWVEGREFRRENSNSQREEEDAVRTYGLVLESIAQLASNWQMVSGIEFYHDVIDSKGQDRNIETNAITPRRGLYPEDSQASNAAVFTAHTFDWNRLSLNVGARFNYFSLQVIDATFGDTEINPTALVGNISARYGLSETQAVTASVNTGFRSPNINDVSTFGSFDFGIETPSAGLESEKTLTFEVGYKVKMPLLTANLAAYHTRLTNLIDRVRSTFNGQATYEGQDVYKKENVAESYVQGLEFDSDFRIANNLSLFTSLIYTYGQNTSNDEPMRRIPPLNGRVALSYRSNAWFGQAEWWFAGEQNRLAGGDKSDHRINPNGTPAWNVLNVKAGYQVQRFSLNIGLQNLLDEAYRIHGSGVDGIGRSVWVSGEVRF